MRLGVIPSSAPPTTARFDDAGACALVKYVNSRQVTSDWHDNYDQVDFLTTTDVPADQVHEHTVEGDIWRSQLQPGENNKRFVPCGRYECRSELLGTLDNEPQQGQQRAHFTSCYK